jgi:hypothetical protein
MSLSLIASLPAASCTRTSRWCEPWRAVKSDGVSTRHGSSRTHREHYGHYLQPKRMLSGWSEAARLRSARSAKVASGPIGAPRSLNLPQITRFHLDFRCESERCLETLYPIFVRLATEFAALCAFSLFLARFLEEKKSYYANRKVEAWPYIHDNIDLVHNCMHSVLFSVGYSLNYYFVLHYSLPVLSVRGNGSIVQPEDDKTEWG